jgi:hypothetical protein
VGHHWARSSPTAGRKVEAGPRVGQSPTQKLPLTPFRDRTRTGVQARRRLRRTTLRLGPASPPAGLDDLCPRSAPHQRTRIPMNSPMHDVLRIESADLDAIASMPDYMPIRVGERIAGKGKINRFGDQFVLDLGANAQHAFKGKRFRSIGSQYRLFCSLCPDCKKWRKRLFLSEVSFGPLSRNFSHAFKCMECIASTDAKTRAIQNHARFEAGNRRAVLARRRWRN